MVPHPKPLSKEKGLLKRSGISSQVKVLSFGEDLGEAKQVL
jgi:hypothetical protein